MKIANFKEKYKDEKEINHVIDYLNSYYKERTINFNYENALEKANEWNNNLNKKNKDLKDSGKVELFLEFENGIKLVRLVDQTAKNWEGLKMDHCVASYKDHEGIYSIRDKNNIPHCTIEIKNEYVNQIKGKGNGKISPKYIKHVISSIKHFNYLVDNYEMKQMGYIVPHNEINKSFNNLRKTVINNQDYLYVGNKWKISKNPIISNEIFLTVCEFGNSIEYVKQYLKCTEKSYYYNYSIVLSSENGHLEIVKELMKDKRVDPSDQNNCSIKCASSNGHLEIVKELMKDKRVDPSDDNNWAMRWASVHGHLDVVKELLKDKRVFKKSDNLLK